jgi:beta-galactosidase/beta-glucuronidase
MCRDSWSSLDGPWQFAYDDDTRGLTERWFEPGHEAFDRSIEVPFPPESSASGIGERGFHPVVWYRREIAADSLADRDEADRVLIHFGAVDHRARVWLDGRLVAEHVGGQTPFTADVTDVLGSEPGAAHVLVVRAEDDPRAAHVPRGKQDWREKPHGIWYERSTGIWQSVWCEVVPELHLVDVAWTPRPSSCLVEAELTLATTPSEPVSVGVRLMLDDEVLAEVSCLSSDRTTRVVVGVPALRNAQDRDRLAWSPEQPTLVDARVVVVDPRSMKEIDRVESYVGLREVDVRGGAFTLNGAPYFTRSVLDQGYRPETHLATRGGEELRAEVETIKAMGFNAVRVHQKAEDPRFHFWADRLGLLVWGETAGAYEFSAEAVELLTAEWMELVRRYRSHPSVVVWVPINESWGVQDIGTDTAQQQYAQALVSLTRALDPSRPAISNEGWEHVDSDILGLHDYGDADTLGARYGDREAAARVVLSDRGPAGRRPTLNERQWQRFLEGRAPLMITEFGGVSLSEEAESWGYHKVTSTSELAEKLTALFDALRASPDVAGFCYTQLMDTGQETNGLLYSDGSPKLPFEQVRAIVTGEQAPSA